MTEFKRDPETGILYAYKDGKLVGPIITMGDTQDVPQQPSRDLMKEGGR